MVGIHTSWICQQYNKIFLKTSNEWIIFSCKLRGGATLTLDSVSATTGPCHTFSSISTLPQGIGWDVMLTNSKAACCLTILHSDWSRRILKATPQTPPGMWTQWEVSTVLPLSVKVKATPIPSPATLTLKTQRNIRIHWQFSLIIFLLQIHVWRHADRDVGYLRIPVGPQS